ncbi:MAG: glycoside hydrolase family 3 C-terminal domain-containing protein [Oscillospiraceae bacterium]|nr:glycoside hydrolase family 3 C-terminal domain-containing protein [Oscillospiraceae bacterium]
MNKLTKKSVSLTLAFVLVFLYAFSYVPAIIASAATYNASIAAPTGGTVEATRLTLKVSHAGLLTTANRARWAEDYTGADALSMWYTTDGTDPQKDNPTATRMGTFFGSTTFAYIVNYKGGTTYRFAVTQGEQYGQVYSYTTAIGTMSQPMLVIDNNIKPEDAIPMLGLTSGLYKRSDVASGIGLSTDMVGGSVYYQTATCTWNAATSQFGTSSVDSVAAATLVSSGTLYNPANKISAAAANETTAIAIRAVARSAAGTNSTAVTFKIRVAEDADYITLKADKDGNILVDLDKFIAQLTLQEKLYLCSGVGGDPVWLQNGYNYPYEVNNDNIFRTGGPAGGSRGIPRFNIPSTALADGPAGLRMWKNATVWMCPAGIGATWNSALATLVGERYAAEAKHYAIDYVLGPGVNNQRNPVSGRNFEYYSEDPYVGGKTAAAQVRGMVGGGVGATLKHFAANDYETGRNSNAYVTERALREIYLRAFEIAVKEGKPTNLMTGYNGINGQAMSSNTWANTTVLRGEWGFGGFVMTDWGGDNGTAGLNAQVDMAQSSQRSEGTYTTWANTAANMVTLNRSVKNVLGVLVKTFAFQGAYGVLGADGNYHDGVALDGTPVVGLTREDIGLRNINFGGSDIQLASSVVNKQAADEAIVLLKNKDNTLPLKGDEKIALVTSRRAWMEVFNPRWYGDSASIGDIMIQGTGSAQVRFNNTTTDYAKTLVEALEDRGFSVVDWKIDFGVAGNNNQAFMNAFYNNLPAQGGKKYIYSAERSAGSSAESSAYTAANNVSNAVAQTNADNAAAAAAAAADVGIFVITRVAGEGADMSSADFEMVAKELIVYEAYERAFHAAGKPMLVLINVGGTVNTTAYRGGTYTVGSGTTAVTKTTDGADAILDIWNPGTSGTDAIADILKGAVNPSGRLAQSFPVGFSDSPSVYMFAEHNRLYTPVYSGNGYNNAAYYADGVYVGYRLYESRPELYSTMVSYPFGYGLSYTKFEYSDLKLDKNIFAKDNKDDKITATVKVTNVGSAAGKEVVQLYLNASTWVAEGRPKNELRAFGKTALLKPGESEVVTLTVGYDELVYFDDGNASQLIPTSNWFATLVGHGQGWTVANDTVFTVSVRTNASEAAKPNQPISGLTDTFKYGEANGEVYGDIALTPKADGSVDARISLVNESEVSANALLIYATYDAVGRMKDISQKEVSAESLTSGTINVNIDGLAVGETVKAFVWRMTGEGFADSYIPICEAASYKK